MRTLLMSSPPHAKVAGHAAANATLATGDNMMMLIADDDASTAALIGKYESRV